jgi:hypothetical protein
VEPLAAKIAVRKSAVTYSFAPDIYVVLQTAIPEI